MKLFRASIFFAAAFAMLPISSVFAASPISIRAAPCFFGMASGDIYPVVVTLHNSGASVEGGRLSASFDSYGSVSHIYSYDVDLPSGSEKQVTVYPSAGREAYQLTLTYSGNFSGGKVGALMQMAGSPGPEVGLIGDDIGGMNAVRDVTLTANAPTSRYNGELPVWRDCYCRPENAPDRATGYQRLTRLVLGDGADRLRPAQIAAIRRWVIGGGSLICLGGPGATYLNSPEFADLLPIVSPHSAAVSELYDVGVGGGTSPGGPMSIMTGTRKSDATAVVTSGDDSILVKRSYGAGMVLLVAYNPLDKPLRMWDHKADLWKSLITWSSSRFDPNSLRQFAMANMGEEQQFGVQRDANDPFRVKLPPLTSVGGIFIVYFIVVVPLTYKILNKMKRLELAWVTTPILSVAFAYVFFLFTADLYKAGQSSRTRGLIIAASGSHEAQFYGYSEMFFPTAGSYALSIEGAEFLDLAPNYEEGYGRNSSADVLETVDDGTVHVPEFSVANLAFRRIYQTDDITWSGGITANLHKGGDGVMTGTVTNSTNSPLTNASLNDMNGTHCNLGSIAPGETKTITRESQTGPNTGEALMQQLTAVRGDTNYGTAGTVAQVVTTAPGAVLLAQTSGQPYGPNLGKDVGKADAVNVMVGIPMNN